MTDYDKKSKQKHKDGKDGSSKKRHRHRDDEDRKHKKKRKDDKQVNIIEDDADEDMWVEKNIDMDGERPLATDIPAAESLTLTSNVTEATTALPPSTRTESTLQRDDWMLEPSFNFASSSSIQRPLLQNEPLTEGYGDVTEDRRTTSGGVDFFSSLGTEAKKKKDPKDLPNPEKPVVSSRELNPNLRADAPTTAAENPAKKAKIIPGGPGSQWRMMRLRKVFEAAEEEGLDVEQVGIDRFGTLEAFEEAKEERRILDERDGNRSEDRGRDRRSRPPPGSGERGFMFNDSVGSSRSSSFRRPGGPADRSPSTSSPPSQMRPPANKRLDSIRLPSQASSPLQQSHTPIPSVMTPHHASGSKRTMSPTSLNKLQAKVLRAKLMNAPDAAALEKEYEEASRATQGDTSSGTRTKVEMLPTIDGHGRLYDVGHGRKDEETTRPGNRKKKEKVETRDPKTGDIVRYNADDEETTLGEMLRQEKFGAGMADQKDLDAQFARAIMGDGKFENDLDYIDDNAEKLGRQKMRSDAMKRQFAINDYKKTQQALATCQFCYGEDDSPPKAPVIAMGTRVYLSCTTNEELLPGHCWIVPIQHHLTMLEGDDDVWDEVRNFMKSLMKMFAEEDKGVIFYETVISIKWQRHTVIECVPLPWEQFDVMPGYFKESILSSEAEWSQHKKLIDFRAKPFRRAMVPNLPYFMVQFDHKGEKGYGHVIEGSAEGAGEDEDGYADLGEKGGGEFPRWFAGEIIGNVVGVEPRRWRRPRKIDFRMNRERATAFRTQFAKYDWTDMIGKS